MYFELFLVTAIFSVGGIFFGHFEQKTPAWRRLLKLAIITGGTALLSATVGRPWVFIWIVGFPAAGVSVHVWWTRKHGIGVMSAEPKDKYYALRGWTDTAANQSQT